MSNLWSPVTPINSDFPEVQTNTKTVWKERNDRQLRLWGIHGQSRIDAANVLLLNASSVGAEVLKNIVLPGFGKFSIVDHRKVTSRDLGKNFYVTVDSIGKSLAGTVCNNLVELNPENVSGNYLEEKIEKVIYEQPQFLDAYNYIIASNVDFKTLKDLAKICEKKKKVLLVVRSYGMIGYIRTYTETHNVIEGKLDTENEISDLRISDPFPKLKKFADKHEFEKMDFKTHAHTPYIVILMKILDEFKKIFKKDFPENEQEEEAFLKLIKQEEKNALERREKELEEKAKQGIEEKDEFQLQVNSQKNEENFQDAINKMFQAWTPYEIHPDLQKVLDDSRADKLTKESDDFWFLVNAAKDFLKNVGKGKYLPLPGNVPDMTSDTERYVKLQSIYRGKARDDYEYVKKIVNSQLESVGRKPGEIDDIVIRDFCKNIHYVRTFSFKSIEDELNPKKINLDLIQSEISWNPLLCWYFLLRSADLFFEKNAYYPGSKQDKDDEQELKEILMNLFKEHDIKDLDYKVDDYVKEFVRFGCGEIHNISSLIGGVGAQELIKMCTAQRLPFVNTWIYDGINGIAQCFNL